MGVRAVIITGLLAAVAATRPQGTAAQVAEFRWDGLIEHLTAAASAPQPNGPSRLSRHSVTRDGRYVVFDSDAINLGPWGEPSAIYRRDRMTGQTERLFGMTGSDAVISGDGHHMAFVHCAGWFRPDMSAICDIYVVDLRNWSIVIASSGLDGTYSDGPSSQPVLSGDGRFIVFRTTASNLVPAGASPNQIMLRDRDADQDGIFDEPEPGAVTLEAISVSSTGIPANEASESAEVSDDGQVVAFRSLAGNLVDGDTNAHWDVFLRDRVYGETRRINVGWDGQQATPTIDSPDISMSADGRFVAFASDDSYMVPQWTQVEDTNNNLDVFVYDRLLDREPGSTWVSMASPVRGHAFAHADRGRPARSGRHLLDERGGTVGHRVAAGGYVHDQFTWITQRVSYKPDWTEANAAWERPVISRDGSLIVLQLACDGPGRARDKRAGCDLRRVVLRRHPADADPQRPWRPRHRADHRPDVYAVAGRPGRERLADLRFAAVWQRLRRGGVPGLRRESRRHAAHRDGRDQRQEGRHYAAARPDGVGHLSELRADGGRQRSHHHRDRLPQRLRGVLRRCGGHQNGVREFHDATRGPACARPGRRLRARDVAGRPGGDAGRRLPIRRLHAAAGVSLGRGLARERWLVHE